MKTKLQPNSEALNMSKKEVLFGRAAPAIPVTNMHEAVTFYTGILGLKKTFENGNPVTFSIVEKDGTEIHLMLVEKHSPAAHNLLHLMVSDAKALHDHLKNRGVPIVKELRDADYGLRQFVFADPDGNKIDVGEELS